MSDNFKVIYSSNSTETICNNHVHIKENIKLPFAQSNLFFLPIIKHNLLTADEPDVARVYELQFSKSDFTDSYEPGQTIGILPSNDINEVNRIFLRLNLESVSEKQYKVEQISGGKKIPKHIPLNGTLRELFEHLLNLHSPPKKAFLKTLAKYCADEDDVKKLNSITNPAASKEYMKFISNEGKSFLKLLNFLPSCHPPIEIVLEHLPVLLPRPYSLSSSPLNKHLSITFNVHQHGVCSRWLEKQIEKINNGEKVIVPLYLRSPNLFSLPEDNTLPIILIATGTGIAPIKSFLEHRLLEKADGTRFGEVYLIYGFRYAKKDFLYKKEINTYVEEGILTEIFTTASRDTESKVYVQHRIMEYGELIHNIGRKGVVYVCGNAEMVKGVKEVMADHFVKYDGVPPEEKYKVLEQLEKSKKYIVDIWS